MTQGTGEITGYLLAGIEAWRERLAKNIALRNPVLSSRELNTAVHRIISRIIILRICEERGIVTPGTLTSLLTGEEVYPRLSDHLPGSGGGKDGAALESFTPDLTIDEKIFDEIREQLYSPGACPEYSAFTPSILGQVFDRFLGKTIRLRGGHHARIEEKPEVKAGGGIHDVPQFAVDYVVRNALGELVGGKTPEEVSKIRILDPVCGSGSFLIGAYQFLIDWHRDWYIRQSGGSPGRVLTPADRERILLQAIHGVDIDPRAVEVTQLTLLLMVLWEVGREMAKGEVGPIVDRVLQCLDRNIRCGNSLVGPDYFRQKQVAPYNFREQKRINPFDWMTGFPDIMDSGGFDAVIGNPPATLEPPVKGLDEYFQTHYRGYQGEADLSVYFMEKGISLLRPGGIFSVVVANRWLRASSGTPLRKWLKVKQIEEIVDFGDLPEFRNTPVAPCILRVTNAPPSHPLLVSRPATVAFTDLDDSIREHRHPLALAELDEGGWGLADARPGKLLGKIREAGTPLDCLIIPRDDKYLRGILNSRLAHLFIRAPRSRGPQAPVLPAHVARKNFPIYVPDFDDPADAARHDRMVALVTRMIDLHRRLHETTLEHEKTVIERQIEATDREIDLLVYELYGLTEEERRIVEEATLGNKKDT
jgi:SAM-dependent methyltransferase